MRIWYSVSKFVFVQVNKFVESRNQNDRLLISRPVRISMANVFEKQIF